MKMFNIALEVLQEASELVLVKNWPTIQTVLMEKTCGCYWNLNMQREYLRKIFEIISTNASNQFIDEIQRDKIRNAALNLDDILYLDFHKFFSVKNLSINTSCDFISLDVVISSNVLMVKLKLKYMYLIMFLAF